MGINNKLSNTLLMALWTIILLINTACHKQPITVAQNKPPSLSKITNFQECVKAGFSILRSFPPKCATPDGKIFTQQRKQKKIKGVSGVYFCDNKCGDGICQQITCQSNNCPCPETPINCKIDCVTVE